MKVIDEMSVVDFTPTGKNEAKLTFEWQGERVEKTAKVGALEEAPDALMFSIMSCAKQAERDLAFIKYGEDWHAHVSDYWKHSSGAPWIEQLHRLMLRH